MKIIIRLNYILLTLLGISTGLVKLFNMKQEMDLFWNAGFSTSAIYVFGVVQILATVAIWFPQTRKTGAGILAATFVVATGVLFINGNIPFGISSILFIVMALTAYRHSWSATCNRLAAKAG